MATVNAAAFLSAVPTLQATGAFIQTGSASLSAGATLGVSGTQTAFSADSELHAAGITVKVAQAALAAPGVLTAQNPTFTSSSVLTATATGTVLAAAALAGSATIAPTTDDNPVALSANAVLLAPGQMGAAVLSAAAQMAVAGQAYRAATAALAASPTLTAAGSNTAPASVPLAAAPALSATSAVTALASAPLTAPGVLTAAPFTAAAALAAPGTLTVSGSNQPLGAAALTAAASLAVAGTLTRLGAAPLAANSVLIVAGFRTQHASAALSAPGALGVTGTRVLPGSAALSAPGSLQAAASDTVLATAHLAASPALTATGVDYAAAHLAAAPVLGAAATVSRVVKAALSAAPVLRASAVDTVFPSAPLAAAPVMAVVPTEVVLAQGLLTAYASLAALADTKSSPLPPAAPPRVQPTWQRDVQHFAIAQERQRHAQALWQYGELVMFCLLWRPKDIDAGLARRCTRCFNPGSVIPVTPAQPDYGAVVESQISAAYGQSQQYRCPLCYGTQVIAAQAAEVPGVRALLVRPAILTDTDQNQQRSAKGVVNPGTVNVQATPDFRAHTYDYLFRSDGRRYQLTMPRRTTLRTGFATPWQQTAAIDYNLMQAALEDPQASVAYLIPPAADLLAQALGTYTRIPISYAWIEQINGPLFPEEQPPPAASGSYQPPVTLPGGLPAEQQPASDQNALLDEMGAILADMSGATIDAGSHA